MPKCCTNDPHEVIDELYLDNQRLQDEVNGYRIFISDLKRAAGVRADAPDSELLYSIRFSTKALCA